MHSVLGMVPVLSEQTLHSPCSRGATQHRTQKTDYIITQLPQELGSHVICILTCWKTMQKINKTHTHSKLSERAHRVSTKSPIRLQYSIHQGLSRPTDDQFNTFHFNHAEKMEEFQGGKDIDQLYWSHRASTDIRYCCGTVWLQPDQMTPQTGHPALQAQPNPLNLQNIIREMKFLQRPSLLHQ